MRRPSNPILLATAWTLLSLSSTQAKAAEDEGFQIRAVNPASEEQDRHVDVAAQSSQDKAIATLNTLLKKYRKTGREPVLLAKLAELYQQQASIRFRIAHGVAHKKKKSLDLAAYRKTMRQSITTLTELIQRYPSYPEIARAYYMRGKAHEEIDEKGPATKDYLHLVNKHPDADERIPAYMSLAEFSIQANDHKQAIAYLAHVEKNPHDPHYPFALYRMAWAYYNLRNIPTALIYVEKHVAFYRKQDGDKKLASKKGQSSDDALRENMLLDATVFFMEGYEQRLSQCGIEDALAYFKKLEKGQTLGKMFLRFAKLLRSHGHELDLVKWKNQILESESDRPEALDVVITAYEKQLNQRRFVQLVDTARDMERLYKKHKRYEAFTSAQKLLLDTAEQLQAHIIKNKAATGVNSLSPTLAAIYDAFTKIVDETDPRIPRVHYNLAETLFQIKEYAKATQHYRWVVEHGKWGKTKGKASVEDASLKAIGSRYEADTKCSDCASWCPASSWLA
jgi:cellulose synthase operon protein C